MHGDYNRLFYRIMNNQKKKLKMAVTLQQMNQKWWYIAGFVDNCQYIVLETKNWCEKCFGLSYTTYSTSNNGYNGSKYSKFICKFDVHLWQKPEIRFFSLSHQKNILYQKIFFWRNFLNSCLSSPWRIPLKDIMQRWL